MSTWLWVIVVIAVAAVAIALLASVIRRRRSAILRGGFGPEYDRAVEVGGGRASGEADLRERQRRREALELRPLPPIVRRGFQAAWQGTQAGFVDDPATAVRDADRLVQSVMRDRGYPVDDFEERAAIVSVDHPVVVERYRRAHAVTLANEDGAASTELLRRAMQDYRALFVELVDDAANETVTATR